MQSLNEIRQRIHAVEQTRKLTNAMYLVATARMKQALPHVEYDRVYFKKVETAMKDILQYEGFLRHPYLEESPCNHCAYIVVAGDKGMAGDYNSAVLNLAWREISAHPNPHIVTVGVMASRFFRERGVKPDHEVYGISQDPSLENARVMTAWVKELFDNTEVDRVFIIYTAFHSTVSTRPILRQLLPLAIPGVEINATKRGQATPMLYHPSPEAVFDRLVPEYMVSAIFAGLVQAYASEHCARMNAMRSATNSADDMLKALRQQYNMARQAAITREITEISAAAQALRPMED